MSAALEASTLVVGLSAPRLPSLWVALCLGYLGAGVTMAWHLGRLGHAPGTTSASLVVWPLLLGLVGRPPSTGGLDLAPTPTRRGPNADAIDGCVASLRRTLADDDAEPGGGAGAGSGTALLDPTQLRSLADALHRADRRIARVDRLLGETEAQGFGWPRAAAGREGAQLGAALAELRAARAHAQAELDAVLAGLVSLRLQLGMFALAGEVEPVRERLAEFEARVAALAELSSIELAQVRP